MASVSTLDRIKEAIEEAPAWTKVALTMRHERLGDRGAQELALCIADHLDGRPVYDHDQLALPLCRGALGQFEVE